MRHERVPIPKIDTQWNAPSRTQQHMTGTLGKDLVSKYTQQSNVPLQYGDFRVSDDVLTNGLGAALQMSIDAKRAFMALPSRVRAFFQNDPAKLDVFLRDSKNRLRAINLGIIPAASLEEANAAGVDFRTGRARLSNPPGYTRPEASPPPKGPENASTEAKKD